MQDDNEELRETTPTAAAPIPSPPSSPRDSATDSQAGDIFCDALEALEEIEDENEALRSDGGAEDTDDENEEITLMADELQFLVKNLDTGLAVPSGGGSARRSTAAPRLRRSAHRSSSRRSPRAGTLELLVSAPPRRRRACRHTTRASTPWSWRIICCTGYTTAL